MMDDAGFNLFGLRWLLSAWLRGMAHLFVGPRRVLGFLFAGERHLWPVYPALFFTTLHYLAILHWVRHGDREALVGSLLVMPTLAGLMLLLADLMDLWGGLFAWRPGLGYPHRDGSLRPLFGQPLRHASGGGEVLRGSALSTAKTKRRPADRALLHLGDAPIPRSSELEHFLIAGKTGAGKTQAIEAMLRTVRARDEACLIADPAGGYLSRFYRDGDLILNPFDRRSPAWSPFAEIRHDYDCDRIAQATIPAADGDSQEWNFYAQSLFAEVLRALHHQGTRSLRELLRLVTSADREELAAFLDGTPAGVLCHKGNDKMLASTRSIAAVYLNAWTWLQDEGSFSLRDWVRDHGMHWAYLTYRDDQLALLRHWIATLLDLAIVEGLTLPDSASRRLWYVLDELDSLGQIPSLSAGVTKLRKHGGAVIAGLQTIAQLRATYGEHTAQSVLSCLSTKLILAAGDNQTAKYFEDELGQQEIRHLQSNESESFTGILDGDVSRTQGRTPERKIQATVLASEIQGLPPLSGFLRPVGGQIRRVTVPYLAMATRVASFEE